MGRNEPLSKEKIMKKRASVLVFGSTPGFMDSLGVSIASQFFQDVFNLWFSAEDVGENRNKYQSELSEFFNSGSEKNQALIDVLRACNRISTEIAEHPTNSSHVVILINFYSKRIRTNYIRSTIALDGRFIYLHRNWQPAT